MNNKNQAIEEMAKKVDMAQEKYVNFCKPKKDCYRCDYNKVKDFCSCSSYFIAEALYNAGYRKVDESEKMNKQLQEIAKLKQDNQYLSFIVKMHKYCVTPSHCQNQGETRKETAREILQEVSHDLEVWERECNLKDDKGFQNLKKFIIYGIAEKFGVEVE